MILQFVRDALAGLTMSDFAAAGAACLWAGLGFSAGGLVAWLAGPQWRRLALASLAASALAVAGGLVLAGDLFCLAGYVTDDGDCAWE